MSRGAGKIVAVTGHRPDKLGGYSDEALYRLTDFASIQIVKCDPSLVITGMAQGWDTAVALACCDLCMPFVAAVPFPDQPKIWPAPAQKRFAYLLSRALRVQYVLSNESAMVNIPRAMSLRNTWMVDRSDELLALHNGSPGGTNNCVRYAEKAGRKIHRVWEEWLAYDPN